jgi:hypothetical protein
MGDEPLRPNEAPQSGGKPYKNDQQRSGFGAYTGGLGAFGKDPISRKTGKDGAGSPTKGDF